MSVSITDEPAPAFAWRVSVSDLDLAFALVAGLPSAAPHPDQAAFRPLGQIASDVVSRLPRELQSAPGASRLSADEDRN